MPPWKVLYDNRKAKVEELEGLLSDQKEATQQEMQEHQLLKIEYNHYIKSAEKDLQTQSAKHDVELDRAKLQGIMEARGPVLRPSASLNRSRSEEYIDEDVLEQAFARP